MLLSQRFCILMGIVLLIAAPRATEATTYYVDASQTASSPTGTGSWSDSFRHLEEALQAAGSGPDTILVAQGTYHPGDTTSTDNTDRSVSFVLRSQVIIRGGYRGIDGIASGHADDRDFSLYETILSGHLDDDNPTATENSYIVVQAGTLLETVDDRAELDGLTIRDGYHFNTDGHGAGLYIFAGSNPIIRDCVIKNNAVPEDKRGGGVLIVGDPDFETTLLGCTIEYNSAGNAGGGLATLGETKIRLEDCIIRHNLIYDEDDVNGAGFYIDYGSEATLSRCQILDNVWDPTIINCDTVNGNNGTWGGGTSAGLLRMRDCLVADNTLGTSFCCLSAGGGINMGEGYVVNTVFERNIAFGKFGCYGGGLSVGVGVSPPPIVSNCIFESNDAGAFEEGGGGDSGGGAIALFSGAQITNVLMHDNYSIYVGGAFFDGVGESVLTNCTMAYNTADGEAGGAISIHRMEYRPR